MAQQYQTRDTLITTNTSGLPAGYTTSTYQPPTSASNLQGNQYYTTNQTYQSGSAQQVYQQGVAQVVQGQPITTYDYTGVPQYAISQSHAVVSAQGQAQRTANSEIPVESRIEYIPFEKKYVEYEQV